ncbi:MAG: hypothetical protein WBC68_07835 [Albidovulum sp.]
MFRALPLIALISACTAAPPEPGLPALGEVHIGATAYPIIALDSAETKWAVDVDGRRVFCSKPEHEACFWSVRNHLVAMDLQDDLS